jgi:hypothetical protein
MVPRQTPIRARFGGGPLWKEFDKGVNRAAHRNQYGNFNFKTIVASV